MTKEKKGADTQDKTSADVNTKAKPIIYPDEVKKKQKQSPENPSGDPTKPKVRKETREIEFHFTPEELQEKGRKLANALQDKAKIEAEKKANADEFKVKIDAKQTEVDVLTENITMGKETKTVTVEVIRNFESGKREYWYGGVKRDEEKLTAKDHQLDLEDAIPKTETDVPFDLPIAAGDWVVTKKGSVVMITADDILHGVDKSQLKRLATEDEIKAGEKKASEETKK